MSFQNYSRKFMKIQDKSLYCCMNFPQKISPQYKVQAANLMRWIEISMLESVRDFVKNYWRLACLGDEDRKDI